MNLHQFRFVQEAAKRNLNLTETAKALHTSQPGVSKAILELEEELGVDIFVRHGKRLKRVTAPGQQVLQSIDVILREINNLKRIGEEYSRQDSGTLSIATTHTQARYVLPAPVAALRKRFPQVTISLHQGTPQQVAERVLDESAEIGLATEALDRLKTTAESHQRVLIVEVMGRHTGWIALHSGMAAGAHAIVVPERPFDIEELTEVVRRRFEAKKKFAIVVVSEGAKPREGTMKFESGGTDVYGHERFAGVARQLSVELEQRLGKEARPVILGHVQRGGTPTAYDRVLATRFGWHAVEAAHNGDFGMMTALRGTDIVLVPLASAVDHLKTVPVERYVEAECVL